MSKIQLPSKEELLQKEKDNLRFTLLNVYEVYTMYSHISTTGVTKRMRLFVAVFNERLRFHQIKEIGWHVSKALDRPCNDNQEITVKGCGTTWRADIVREISNAIGRDLTWRAL